MTLKFSTTAQIFNFGESGSSDGNEKWVPFEEAQKEIAKIILEGSIYNGELLNKVHCLEAKIVEANKILDDFPHAYRFNSTDATDTSILETDDGLHFNIEAQINWLKRLREVLK